MKKFITAVQYFKGMESEGDTDSSKIYSVDNTIFLRDLSLLKSIANETTLDIVNYLTDHPSYPLEISKNTGIDRQKVYYYIRHLENAGIIKVVSRINKSGSTAKIYEKSANAVSFVFDENVDLESRAAGKSRSHVPRLYSHFVTDGVFNGYICVGSPDPHGEYKASTRDTHMAILLGLYIGSFASIPEHYPIALDTDIVSKNLIKNNLIVIGGPVTNIVTKMIDDDLPVKFLKEDGWMLYDGSRIHSSDYEGVVQKIKNPFDETKEIIQIGGNKNSGTLAAILASTRFLEEFAEQGKERGYMIVRGVDINGDGIVDSAEKVD